MTFLSSVFSWFTSFWGVICIIPLFLLAMLFIQNCDKKICFILSNVFIVVYKIYSELSIISFIFAYLYHAANLFNLNIFSSITFEQSFQMTLLMNIVFAIENRVLGVIMWTFISSDNYEVHKQQLRLKNRLYSMYHFPQNK